MNVLVDTSVWIRFLSDRAPFAKSLDALLADDRVVGHEFVFGELLVGDRGGRQPLLTNYRRLPQIPPVPHAEVMAFLRARKLHGRGIGLIDAHLLASALVAGTQLWTADVRLDAIADELGIAYKMPDRALA